MFSAKFYVRTDKNNSLRLRITNNRKKAELSLGFQMTEETLSDAMSTKPRKENVRYKSILTRWQVMIEDIKLQLAKERRGDEDVNVVKTLLSEALLGTEETVTDSDSKTEDSATSGNFFPFFMSHAQSYFKRSTRESNEYTMSCIKKFAPDTFSALNFEDINYAWLSDFDKFMETKGLSKNTRRIHFANIRAAVNDAYKRELTDADPFRRFRLKTEKTAKRSLPVDELRKLFEYDTEPHAVYYRDMFKLIFMQWFGSFELTE